MSLPYERPNLPVAVEDAALLYEFPGPSRTYLQKLIVVRDEGNESVSESNNDDFSVEVFNRAFTAAAVNILGIQQAAGNRCAIIVDANPQLRPQDPVDVDGTAGGQYNGMHRVTAIEKLPSGAYKLLTNRAFGTAVSGGTLQLNILGQDEEMYRVLEPVASVGGVVKYNPDDGTLFENQDPRRHDGSSHERKIYLRFSITGNYRVTLGFCGVESQG